METAPRAALEVIEPHLALEILVVAFDAPAELGDAHQLLERHVRRQRGEVEPRLVVARLPLAEQPLLVTGRPPLRVSFGRAYSIREKLRGELAARSFAPGDRLVLVAWDVLHQLGDLARLLVAIPPSR